MPRTEEQFEEIRGKSKKKMMETALKLFSLHGYHATSISKIAKEAGISTGLVYNYFSSKEELLNEIVKGKVEQFNGLLQVFAQDAITRNDIVHSIEQIFESLKQNMETWKLFTRMLLQPEISGLAKRNMVDFSHQIAHFSEVYFRSKGESQPDVKAKALAALMHGAFYHYILDEDEEMYELVKNEIIQKFT